MARSGRQHRCPRGGARPRALLTARHDRLIPNAAIRLIRQHAPSAVIVELDAPHFLLQCAAQTSAGVIRQFLHSNAAAERSVMDG